MGCVDPRQLQPPALGAIDAAFQRLARLIVQEETNGARGADRWSSLGRGYRDTAKVFTKSSTISQERIAVQTGALAELDQHG